MTAQMLGSLILWLIVIVIAVSIAVYLMRWLYRRSTKETAFVRTGFMGEKVVINGGAFVIPVIHEISPVNMRVMQIEVKRGQQNALITKDRIRVDITAEFYVRVRPSKESVANAAQTLGTRAIDPQGMMELLEGKFVSALRAVAASMTLQEMHEKRGEYMKLVQDSASEALDKNGLELESVALSDLDQTSTEFFDPTNIFDAEGLTTLTENIEARRKSRNDVEQETMIQIRNRNLESERKALEIDRESEYARLEQEREVEIRKAMQQSELAQERAAREQEAEQAKIEASQQVESARILQERTLSQTRIENEREVQQKEIDRRRAIEEMEIATQKDVESNRIKTELAIEKERIARLQEQERLEQRRRTENELTEREGEISLAKKALEVTSAQTDAKQAEIQATLELERSQIAQDRALDQVRIERERELQTLQINKRKAMDEEEIIAEKEIEQSRLETNRSVEEIRINLQKELRTLEVEQQKLVEIAELDKTIELTNKSKERSAAVKEAESARAQAIEAEEKAFTVREKEIANRRKMIELINVTQQVEQEGMRLVKRAEAEKEAAESAAESERIAAQAKADADNIAAEVAKIRYAIDAMGNTALNEADNVLTPEARASRLRQKLLDKVEGIVRESVKPMERIEGIKILHVDGINGQGGDSNRNVTDEVIDSALRYRVQAPMIDNLMKEVGIEGGSLGRMTDVLRDAKDIENLTRNKKSGEKGKESKSVIDSKQLDEDRDDQDRSR